MHGTNAVSETPADTPQGSRARRARDAAPERCAETDTRDRAARVELCGRDERAAGCGPVASTEERASPPARRRPRRGTRARTRPRNHSGQAADAGPES